MLLYPDLILPALALAAEDEQGGPLLRPVLAAGGAPLPAIVLATLRASNAASPAAPVEVVGAGVLNPAVSDARAQTPPGVRATALGGDALTWQEFAADVPRFNGSARRLLAGGQRTQLIRNPRFEGATLGVIGAGGVAPTHMTLTPGANQTVEIIAIGTVQGLPCMELEIVATAASSATFSIEAASSIPLAASTTYTASGLCQITGGSLTNVSLFGVRGRTDVTSAVNGGVASFLGASASELTRSVAAPFTTAADATLGRVQLLFATSGAASTRFRIAAPQFEIGRFASSPILPAVATPAASTRGADLVSATLASLGVAANGACTILGTAMIPQAAPAAANQMIVNIDDGTDSNRFRLHNAAGGLTLVAGRVLAGAVSDATSAGSMTAGTLFRWGLSMNGAGRVASCVEGGAVRVVTGGPTGGLTTLRIGNNAAGASPMHGEVGLLRLSRGGVGDSELQRLVAGLPI